MLIYSQGEKTEEVIKFNYMPGYMKYLLSYIVLLFVNPCLCQHSNTLKKNLDVQLASDFRFVIQFRDTLPTSQCSIGKGIEVSIYPIHGDYLINRFFFCSNVDSIPSDKLVQVADFDFDGYTDFRIFRQRASTSLERTLARPEILFDYDYYMYKVKTNNFYRHFISSLRQIEFDFKRKVLTGNLYEEVNNSSNKRIPKGYTYVMRGNSLKYVTITPRYYPPPNTHSSSFNSLYKIFENNQLRAVMIKDTLALNKVEKRVGDFIFEKERELYPRLVNMEKNSNLSYRNIYRIFSSNNGQVISEIIGESESMFAYHSDSIYTDDVNFDGYPDLSLKNEMNNTYSLIYLFDAVKKSFVCDPLLKSLEDLQVDKQQKMITGKISRQASVINRYGQLTKPKTMIWQEYQLMGNELKYVKMETKSFNPNKRLKVKTSFYTYENYALKPMRKRSFRNRQLNP